MDLQQSKSEKTRIERIGLRVWDFTFGGLLGKGPRCLTTVKTKEP